MIYPNVAVTGASGHVGANLIRLLLQQNRTVRVLVRHDTRAMEGLNVERIHGDLSDPDTLRKLCDGVDSVFHAAGTISLLRKPEPGLAKDNVDGTRNMVQAALACNVKRFVHFSTIHIFSPNPPNQPVDENRALVDPSTAAGYDASKKLSDDEVLKGIQQGLNAVIVNPTAVMGPHDYKPSQLGGVLRRLFQRRFQFLVHAGYYWIDVDDVALGSILAEEKGRTGERYLLAGHYHPFHEVVDMIENILGKPVPHAIVPMWLAQLAAPFAQLFGRLTRKSPIFTPYTLDTLLNHQQISDAKARSELGFQPRSLQETLERLYHWLNEVEGVQGK
jgi:dihydroflavonol-4-reductase